MSVIKKIVFLMGVFVVTFFSCYQQAFANQIIRDAEIEATIDSIVNVLLEQVGKTQNEVSIYLVADPSINAFVQGGQNIFIHTGLITSLNSHEELAAVLAHELGHITGGHLLKSQDAQTEATFDALLTGAVVGIAAGLSGGSGDAVTGALLAGSQAGLGSFTSFTRTQEASADQAALDILRKSSITPEAMVSVLKMLSQNERGATSYMRSHPLSRERIDSIMFQLKNGSFDLKSKKQFDNLSYQRMQAKLNGFILEPNIVLSRYTNQTNQFSDIIRVIAISSAYHKMGKSQEAYQLIEKSLENYPNDAYLYDLAGQIALEIGKIDKALTFYQKAYEKSYKNPLIALSYGKALIASEKKENIEIAIPILKSALMIEKKYAQGLSDLSIAYDRIQKPEYATLYSAEYFLLKGNYEMAMNQAQKSLLYLKSDDPKALRARDILFFTQNQSTRR